MFSLCHNLRSGGVLLALLALAGCALGHRGGDASSADVSHDRAWDGSTMDRASPDIAPITDAADPDAGPQDAPRDAVALDAFDAPASEATPPDVRRGDTLDTGDAGDWTDTGDAGRIDAGVPPADSVVHDTGPAVDTGMLDTGATDMAACGGNGHACCAFGMCSSSARVCVQLSGETTPLCHDCGDDHQPCCAFGACNSAAIICVQLGSETTPSCHRCGGMGQPCCAGPLCGDPRMCQTLAGDPGPTCH